MIQTWIPTGKTIRGQLSGANMSPIDYKGEGCAEGGSAIDPILSSSGTTRQYGPFVLKQRDVQHLL